MSRCAVFVSGQGAPGTVVQAYLDSNGCALSSVKFCCAAQVPEDCTAQYGSALAISSSSQSLPRTVLAAIARSLTPGASLTVATDPHHVDELKKDLLLSGFLDSKVVSAGGTGAAHTMVVANRPTWEVGAKAALNLKRPAAPAAAAAAPAPSVQQAWKLSADDDDADEMLDDEQLLTEEDKQRPVAAAAGASDCSTSRKACKNCSCGRAEKEAAGEKVKLTQEMLDNPQTNCGSCALGDAFRCAGCPYRGLPAFEPGKKIQLPADFLTADA